MSIASEITRLYGVRDDIFTSITNKGVTVPSNSKLDDVPTLVGSIPSGGGGTANAFTLDYVNPNQYCTFNNNPDCARPNTTITPQYALTNNYVLDNLTLNGSNIQGSSFTMPSTDSVVGMVVHQIQALVLKFGPPTPGYGGFDLGQLQVNSSTPNVIRTYKEYSGGGIEDYDSAYITALNSGNKAWFGLSGSYSVYIIMNAPNGVVSFTISSGYGGPCPTEIIYDNQVIHSADVNISYDSVTFINLVPQS